MNQEIARRQVGAGEVRTDKRSRCTGSDNVHSRDENPRSGFNRYIYENLLCHVESQIETWNRKAVRDPNPEAAHALWLKAEGLGYALRLLYAFEPEFRELVECALKQAGLSDEVCTSQDLERKSL